MDQMDELKQRIFRMGALAEAILEKAERAVRERSTGLATEVRDDDVEIDRLEVELDDAILRALALQSPVAADLRLVMAVKSMAVDLERVGDLARNIAKSAERLASRSETDLPARLEPLQSGARRLLREALDSFQHHDADAARSVIADDDAIDSLQDEVVQRLVTEIQANTQHAQQALDVIFIAESLERVADHATNIAEDVILVAEARNVKHAEKLERTGS